MQFKVPQFLEIEDKIFGPFTFREFVYLAGGAGLCFVLYKLLGFWIALVPMGAIASLSLALTFYKPNNKPFINMLEAGFNFVLQDKLYIWERRKVTPGEMQKRAPNMAEVGKEGKMNRSQYGNLKLGSSKLKDLAWSLDVLDLRKQTEKTI